MFQVFNIPRVNYGYYRPTIYLRRYIPIESYLLNSIRQAQEFENMKYILYNSLIRQQQKEESLKPKAAENQNENNNDNINDNINDQPTDETEKVQQKTVSSSSPIYYFESHSRFDGKNLVEERKERKIDSEGKVHQKLKRRLGDQWYETEQIEDKEGHVVNKETWHNVPENEVENFKEEWLSKTGQIKSELTQDCNKKPESENKNEEKKLGNLNEEKELGNLNVEKESEDLNLGNTNDIQLKDEPDKKSTEIHEENENQTD